jgi:hypothetical protein
VDDDDEGEEEEEAESDGSDDSVAAAGDSDDEDEDEDEDDEEDEDDGEAGGSDDELLPIEKQARRLDKRAKKDKCVAAALVARFVLEPTLPVLGMPDTKEFMLISCQRACRGRVADEHRAGGALYVAQRPDSGVDRPHGAWHRGCCSVQHTYIHTHTHTKE